MVALATLVLVFPNFRLWEAFCFRSASWVVFVYIYVFPSVCDHTTLFLLIIPMASKISFPLNSHTFSSQTLGHVWFLFAVFGTINIWGETGGYGLVSPCICCPGLGLCGRTHCWTHLTQQICWVCAKGDILEIFMESSRKYIPDKLVHPDSKTLLLTARGAAYPSNHHHSLWLEMPKQTDCFLKAPL